MKSLSCHACEIPLTTDEAQAERCLICGAILEFDLDLSPHHRRKLELSRRAASQPLFLDPPHTGWQPVHSAAASHHSSTGQEARGHQFVLRVRNSHGEPVEDIELPGEMLLELPQIAPQLQAGRYEVISRAAPGEERTLMELAVEVLTSGGNAATEARVSILESSGRQRLLDPDSWPDFWSRWQRMCASLEVSRELENLESTRTLTATCTIGQSQLCIPEKPPAIAVPHQSTKPSAGPPRDRPGQRLVEIDAAMATFGNQPQSKAARLTRWIGRSEE